MSKEKLIFEKKKSRLIYVPDKMFCVTVFNRLTPNDSIYGSYRTANFQTLHFIYLFNKYRYWIF